MTPSNPSAPVSCADCTLGGICLPSGIPDAERAQLSGRVQRNRPVQKGDILYRAGGPFTGIVALRSGSAKLVHTDVTGRESIISVLLPGELTGFDGLHSSRHRCSLIALETSSYCELPPDELRQLTHHSPVIQETLLQRAGEQLDLSIERIVRGHRPAEARLAGFLLDLAERFKQRGFSQSNFRLSLTRQELGDHLGLALETISRLLSRFESAGLIHVEGKWLEVRDPEGLEKIARH